MIYSIYKFVPCIYICPLLFKIIYLVTSEQVYCRSTVTCQSYVFPGYVGLLICTTYMCVDPLGMPVHMFVLDLYDFLYRMCQTELFQYTRISMSPYTLLQFTGFLLICLLSCLQKLFGIPDISCVISWPTSWERVFVLCNYLEWFSIYVNKKNCRGSPRRDIFAGIIFYSIVKQSNLSINSFTI